MAGFPSAARDLNTPKPAEDGKDPGRGLNAMRAVCSRQQPARPAYHSFFNSYIPSFGMLFHILSGMNDHVTQNLEYIERAQDWIPQVSNLVFSVLAYVQILRASRFSNHLTFDQAEFLNYFLSMFPLEHILIPGPLVPIFRSISVANPGMGTFRDVSPFIPPLTFSEETLYTMTYSPRGSPAGTVFTGIGMMLPHIPLMLNQLIQVVLHSHSGHNFSSYRPLKEIFGVPRPNEQNIVSDHFDTLTRSVGFWNRPVVRSNLVRRFSEYINQAGDIFPPSWTYVADHAPPDADPGANPPRLARAANWTRYSSFSSFMQMDKSCVWFRFLVQGVNGFNSHWNENTPLSEIHPVYSKAGLIRFREVEYKHYEPTKCIFGKSNLSSGITHYLNYDTYATTSCPHIVLEDLQDAQIAQLNITCNHSFGTQKIGDIGVTVFGDYWKVFPDVLVTDRVELAPSLRLAACQYLKDK